MIIVRTLFITATLITISIAVGLGIASQLPFFCALTNPSILLKKWFS